MKLGIALDMASTPVSAELPEEKAFSSKNRLIPAIGVPIGVCKSAGTLPVRIRITPRPIRINKASTNRYTG
ncbi:hypothetical protein D3C85_1782260 [compost metagenome]